MTLNAWSGKVIFLAIFISRRQVDQIVCSKTSIGLYSQLYMSI
jgi:hypothetical protein